MTRPSRILILGGTSEASTLAKAVARAGLNAVFSYAGRTRAPHDQPLETRIGGFGGISGLTAYLHSEAITHVVDATHPFAAQMSANAIAACTQNGTPLIALERAPWVAGPNDNWTHVHDMAEAVASLAGPQRRIFLAIGRQHIALFAAQPQHHYLLRLVDTPTDRLPLPNTTVVIDRGPFDAATDLTLIKTHTITCIVAKNSGGDGASAKLAAARQLGIPVIMVQRPTMPERHVVSTVADVLDFLHHTPSTLRGV